MTSMDTVSMRHSASRLLLAVSLLLFLACLPLSSFCVAQPGCREWPSWSLLVFGWVTMFGGWPYVTWLANPLLLLTWVSLALSTRLLSLMFSAAALALGASFALTKQIVTNEGGVPGSIASFEWGYKLWVASMVASVMSALLVKDGAERRV